MQIERIFPIRARRTFDLRIISHQMMHSGCISRWVNAVPPGFGAGSARCLPCSCPLGFCSRTYWDIGSRGGRLLGLLLLLHVSSIRCRFSWSSDFFRVRDCSEGSVQWVLGIGGASGCIIIWCWLCVVSVSCFVNGRVRSVCIESWWIVTCIITVMVIIDAVPRARLQ